MPRDEQASRASQKGPFLRRREQVPTDTYETRLKDTLLLQVTTLAARIEVPSAFATAWLDGTFIPASYVIGKRLR
jgi:hypothetical protein